MKVQVLQSPLASFSTVIKGMNMKIFHTSDHHFCHENIIEYCHRPFKTLEEMHEIMIQRWNETVTDLDLVIHHGDFAFRSPDNVKEVLDKLNGKKILIMGNHDSKKTVTFWMNVGFDLVFKEPIQIGGTLLSHRPYKWEGLNIHGHVHQIDLESKNHICVCVEHTDYRPIELNYVQLKNKTDLIPIGD